MNLWLVVIVAGVITYLIRLSFILLLGDRDIPELFGRALRFVPPAVLSAIIFPELLIQEGSLSLSIGNPRLIAGILAALVAWRTKNVVFTFLVGMISLWILQSTFMLLF